MSISNFSYDFFAIKSEQCAMQFSPIRPGTISLINFWTSLRWPLKTDAPSVMKSIKFLPYLFRICSSIILNMDSALNSEPSWIRLQSLLVRHPSLQKCTHIARKCEWLQSVTSSADMEKEGFQESPPRFSLYIDSH